MPQRDTTGIGERIPRELLDGDFGIAFSFVEMADDESRRGNGQAAEQLLQSADRILDGIRERLLRLTAEQRTSFDSRCSELSAALARVRESASESSPEAE